MRISECFLWPIIYENLNEWPIVKLSPSQQWILYENKKGHHDNKDFCSAYQEYWQVAVRLSGLVGLFAYRNSCSWTMALTLKSRPNRFLGLALFSLWITNFVPPLNVIFWSHDQKCKKITSSWVTLQYFLLFISAHLFLKEGNMQSNSLIQFMVWKWQIGFPHRRLTCEISNVWMARRIQRH